MLIVKQWSSQKGTKFESHVVSHVEKNQKQSILCHILTYFFFFFSLNIYYSLFSKKNIIYSLYLEFLSNNIYLVIFLKK